jgi:hypothetical protein
MSRAKVIGAVFALSVGSAWLASCSSQDTGAETPPVDPAAVAGVSADEQSVYAAVLAQRFAAPNYVLYDWTSTDDLFGTPEEILPGVLQQLGGGADPAIAVDFVAANRKPGSLPANMPLGAPYVLMADAQVAQLFSSDLEGGWATFYAQHPGARGIDRLSRVGFNQARDQALVYVGATYASLGGDGIYFLLRRSGATWTVDKEAQVWIS